MKPMRVHVTGGSGFLGGHVIPLLVHRGFSVTAMARSRDAADKVARLGAEPLRADLDDPQSVKDAFATAKAGVLVNLASLGFGHGPTIVAGATDAGIRRATFISTTAIFTTLNVASKSLRQQAERTIMDSGLDWTILRPTMIYGAPGDRNMDRLLGFLRNWPVVPLPGGGGRLQQPVHVEDVARCVVASLDGPGSVGAAYDVAGPDAITLRQVVEEAARAIGRHPTMVPLPLRPVRAFVRLYERVSPRPRLKAEQIERLAEDKVFDIGPARRDLDFRPRTFAEGIRQEAALLG